MRPNRVPRPDDDGVVVAQIRDGGDRGFLIELEVCRLGSFLRDGLRDALDVDLRSDGASPLGDRLGHRLDVAVRRIVEN